MSSRMVHELHCDAPGCGSCIGGSEVNQVLHQAMEIQGWQVVSMTTSPGNIQVVYFCALHERAA